MSEISIPYDAGRKLGTVEGKIRDVVSRMNEPVAYQFCNWAQANVELDKITCPTIVYVLPPAGTLDFAWNEVRDSPSTQIAFVCPCDFDFDGTENDGAIEAMKRLCIRFMRVLEESGYFVEIEGPVAYQVLYDHLDQNVTGIVITPKLTEISGVNICKEERRR